MDMCCCPILPCPLRACLISTTSGCCIALARACCTRAGAWTQTVHTFGGSHVMEDVVECSRECYQGGSEVCALRAIELGGCNSISSCLQLLKAVTSGSRYKDRRNQQ